MLKICSSLFLFSLISVSTAAPAGGGGAPAAAAAAAGGAARGGSTSGSRSGTAGAGAVGAGLGRDSGDTILTAPVANQPKPEPLTAPGSQPPSTETITTHTDASGTGPSKSNIEIIDAIAKSQGTSREVLVDRPAAHKYNITAYPNTDPSASPNSFFTPLNSSYHACFATLTDVLCLPNGTYDFGRESVLGESSGRYFSLADAQFLVMPKGASVTLRSSANTAAQPNVDYVANVTSGDALKKDITARTNTEDPKPSIRSAQFIVNVPFDEPSVCTYAEAEYKSDSYCFGPGKATVKGIQMLSFRFHGKAVLEGTWSSGGKLSTFKIDTDTPDMWDYLKAGRSSGQIEAISITVPKK